MRNVSNAVVQNCTVAHFEVGIRLRGAIKAIVDDDQDNTRYGLEITRNFHRRRFFMLFGVLPHRVYYPRYSLRPIQSGLRLCC